jgi:hypothetical protein
MVLGLGAPGLLLFVLGLPVLLWLVLRRYNRVVDGQHMMEDEQVSLEQRYLMVSSSSSGTNHVFLLVAGCNMHLAVYSHVM